MQCVILLIAVALMQPQEQEERLKEEPIRITLQGNLQDTQEVYGQLAGSMPVKITAVEHDRVALKKSRLGQPNILEVAEILQKSKEDPLPVLVKAGLSGPALTEAVAKWDIAQKNPALRRQLLEIKEANDALRAGILLQREMPTTYGIKKKQDDLFDANFMEEVGWKQLELRGVTINRLKR